jgi:hypothetical protein
MTQRLALADIIIADVTSPNGNVYYEVGARQAAKEHGCLLISADWAKPHLRHRADAVGALSAAAGRANSRRRWAIRDVLRHRIPPLLPGLRQPNHRLWVVTVWVCTVSRNPRRELSQTHTTYGRSFEVTPGS